MNFREPEKEFSQEGVIDRFEEDKAVIILKGFEGHEILYWPKEKLPPGVKEGDVVWLRLFRDIDLTKEREILARKILEEIINSPKNEE